MDLWSSEDLQSTTSTAPTTKRTQAETTEAVAHTGHNIPANYTLPGPSSDFYYQSVRIFRPFCNQLSEPAALGCSSPPPAGDRRTFHVHCSLFNWVHCSRAVQLCHRCFSLGMLGLRTRPQSQYLLGVLCSQACCAEYQSQFVSFLYLHVDSSCPYYPIHHDRDRNTLQVVFLTAKLNL